MRAGVHLLDVKVGGIGGMETVIREYLVALADIGVELRLAFSERETAAGIAPARPNVGVEIIEPKEREGLRARLGLWGLDAWFCPQHNLDPRPVDLPSVVLLSDIQDEYYPEFFSSETLQGRQRTYRPSCEAAVAVITPTEYTRQAILQKYAVAPEKVFVVPHGVSRRFDASAQDPGFVRRKYGLPEIYAYYPANFYRHKNHVMLAEAIAIFQSKTGYRLPVLLTGADFGGKKPFEQLSAKLGVSSCFRDLGWLPASEIPALYAGAALVVFPSMFEGFGLPLLEAMQAGVPIVASDAACIPEVAGDAALLAHPAVPEQFADAMIRLLSDVPLRRDLIARGRRRAQFFTWERAAKCLRQVLEAARQLAQSD